MSLKDRYENDLTPFGRDVVDQILHFQGAYWATILLGLLLPPLGTLAALLVCIGFIAREIAQRPVERPEDMWKDLEWAFLGILFGWMSGGWLLETFPILNWWGF